MVRVEYVRDRPLGLREVVASRLLPLFPPLHDLDTGKAYLDELGTLLDGKNVKDGDVSTLLDDLSSGRASDGSKTAG